MLIECHANVWRLYKRPVRLLRFAAFLLLALDMTARVRKATCDSSPKTSPNPTAFLFCPMASGSVQPTASKGTFAFTRLPVMAVCQMAPNLWRRGGRYLRRSAGRHQGRPEWKHLCHPPKGECVKHPEVFWLHEGYGCGNPQGHHLGTIDVPDQSANLARRDKDYRAVYVTATTSLYQGHRQLPYARLSVPSMGVEPSPWHSLSGR